MTTQNNKNEENVFYGCAVTQDGALVLPSGSEHNHIEYVSVLIGRGDDYECNEAWEFDTESKGLTRMITYKKGERMLVNRLRGEPMIAVCIKEECGDRKWEVTIGHHKGRIFFYTERLT